MSSQLEWNDYALAIAGQWQLCANCAPDVAGKKLFRQYNFNRLLVGKPILLSPIDATEYASTEFISIRYTDYQGLFPSSVSLDWSPPVSTEIITAVLGRSMQNPFVDLTGLTIVAAIFSGPAFDWAVKVCTSICQPDGPAVAFKCCAQTQNGAPGNSSVASALWFQP